MEMPRVSSSLTTFAVITLFNEVQNAMKDSDDHFLALSLGEVEEKIITEEYRVSPPLLEKKNYQKKRSTSRCQMVGEEFG
jgi:hypothetical protein